MPLSNQVVAISRDAFAIATAACRLCSPSGRWRQAQKRDFAVFFFVFDDEVFLRISLVGFFVFAALLTFRLVVAINHILSFGCERHPLAADAVSNPSDHRATILSARPF